MKDDANTRNCDRCRGQCNPIGRLKRTIGGDVLFIEPSRQGFGCPHLLYFGDEVICTCPTRKALAGGR